MITNDSVGVFLSWRLLLLMVSSIAGCGVGVPSKPAVEVERSQPVRIAKGAVISLGPRRLLEEISAEIEKKYQDIEIVDGLLFRDTAFPKGGWNLETLLQPNVSTTVSEQLDADYLVLVGQLELGQGEEEGFFFPMLVGAMSIEGFSTISAVILDLRTGKLVSKIDCEARGTSYIFHYVIFIAGNEPLLGSGATKGLAGEIGALITELSPTGKRRVAVLALEYPDKAGKTPKSGDDALLDQVVRTEVYAHRSDEELRAAAKQGTDAYSGEADTQLQRYFGLVGTDAAAAHALLCESADQGHPRARYQLALIYENGNEGVKRDLVKAYMWYVLAGESGEYWGGRHALRLKQDVLGPEELSAAQQAVQEWRPGQCKSVVGANIR
jgi:hypothetical protein